MTNIIEISSDMEPKEKVLEKLEGLGKLPPNYDKKGYKFVLADNPKVMRISTVAAKSPNHKELGDGKKREEIITAGYINPVRENGEIKEFYFNNQSNEYNPTFESLAGAGEFIKLRTELESKLQDRNTL